MLDSMVALNRTASAAATALELRCATDVTGFGLLGHAHEVAVRSEVRLELDAGAVPALPGALEVAEQGIRTGGDRRNREFAAPFVESTAAPALEALAYDPQTAGGLLFTLPAERRVVLEAAFVAAGLRVWAIGRVTTGSGVSLDGA